MEIESIGAEELIVRPMGERPGVMGHDKKGEEENDEQANKHTASLARRSSPG